MIFIRTKMGTGNWKVKEELALNEEREFTLLTSRDLEDMISVVGFKKMDLYYTKDKTRELYWLNLFATKN